MQVALSLSASGKQGSRRHKDKKIRCGIFVKGEGAIITFQFYLKPTLVLNSFKRSLYIGCLQTIINRLLSVPCL